MLDIHLLGTPRIFLNGEQITVQRKTTRSLFFYLAMHPNGVDRNALAELFGGKRSNEKKNRQNLRRQLNFLRNIQKDMEALVPQIIDQEQEEIRQTLEMLVRAYDPCISCSTHYLNVEFV